MAERQQRQPSGPENALFVCFGGLSNVGTLSGPGGPGSGAGTDAPKDEGDLQKVRQAILDALQAQG